TNTSTPTAAASYVGVGILAKGDAVTTTVTGSPEAKTYVGAKASVATGSDDSDFEAKVKAITSSTGSGVDASGLFAAGTAHATATLSPVVDAGTYGTGTLTGHNVTFLSMDNSDSSGNADVASGGHTNSDGSIDPAYAAATLGSGALVGGFSG